MPFVRFTQSGRISTPRVSLSRIGMLTFNHASRIKYKLQDYNHVVLYYDDERRRIGIELTNNTGADGATRLRVRSTGADVSAKSFMSFFAIQLNATTSYPLCRDEETGYLVFDLEEGRERGTSTKAKAQV